MNPGDIPILLLKYKWKGKFSLLNSSIILERARASVCVYSFS